MSAGAHTLIATINGNQVGNLRDEANIWSFEYAPEWTISPAAFDLAPNLPRKGGKIIDGGTTRPVQWFFDNLLPEESARAVLAKEAQIQSTDAFGLLAHYGKESAGAITLLAPGEPLGESGYLALTDAELHERISKLPHQSLAAGAPKRMSNAGAQHKLAVAMCDGQLFYPKGDTPSTHILKPDHSDSDSWPHSVANEYFVMQLAGRLGLRVPPVAIRFVPDPIYLVERFDRRVSADETHRLHIIDACQLLGIDRSFKYTAASVENLGRCVESCNRPARARLDVLAWVLFNLLTGNGDAHLKNLSFRVGAEGIELAPFYDLLSTECHRTSLGIFPRWPETELTTRIGAAGRFRDVTAEDFHTFAAQLGVNRRTASRLLADFTKRIQPAADALYAEFEQLHGPQGIVREGQLKTLRRIRLIIIHDMAQRLRDRASETLA